MHFPHREADTHQVVRMHLICRPTLYVYATVLVFPHQTGLQYSDGEPPNGGEFNEV